jgi:hypothetical protein
VAVQLSGSALDIGRTVRPGARCACARLSLASARLLAAAALLGLAGEP